MTTTVRLDADLEFSVETPPTDGFAAGVVTGTVRAIGKHVEVRSDELMSLAGQPSRAEVRQVAAALAARGLTVYVRGAEGIVVTLGVVGSAPFSRLVTRSRHMKVGSVRQALTAVAARRRSAPGAVRIEAPSLPPGTLWPPLPTMHRRSRTPTTTHDPAGGGHPRLYVADTRLSSPTPGMVLLQRGTTTIGSAPGMDIVLDGMDDLQAEIVRNDEDEYELVARSTTVFSTVGGQQLPRQLLRTGSRIELGPWRMSYVRDEFADHGRPYGGRIGGELGRQRTQPRPPNSRPGAGF